MAEERLERLLPALTAMSNSMELQSASLSNVLEGELIRADADFDDAIEPSQDAFSMMGNALSIIENEMMTQTQLLSSILAVNQESLNIRKKEITKENRSERLGSVSGENQESDDKKSGDKSGFAKMMAALGKERVSLKKGLLLAAAIPLIKGAIQGLVDSFFGEESSKQVKDALDSVFDFETIATTSLGTLLFGLKGGLMGLIFSKVRQGVEAAAEKLGASPEVADAISIAVAGIAAAMVTKAGRNAVKSIFNAATRALGPAGAAAGTAAAQTAARSAAAGAGAGAATGASETAAEADKPKPRPTAEMKERIANLTDEELDQQGMKRDKAGRVQYKTGGIVNKADLVEKLQEADIEKAKVKFPGFGPIAKVLGPIGYGFAVYEMATILNDDTLSRDEKSRALSGLAGGILGGVGGAAAGAALGTLVGGPIGTFIGGVGLGIAGAFAGDYLGEQVANYALGDPVDPPPDELQALAEAELGNQQSSSVPSGQSRRERRAQSVAKSTAQTASVAPESTDTTSGSIAPVTADMSPSQVAEAQLTAPNALLASADAELAMIEKAIMVQFGTSPSGGSVNVPFFNNGGNTVNNMGGNNSSTTINVFEDAKQALSNAVPIPMSARA